MEQIRSCTVIYNPVASSFNNEKLEQVVQRLKQEGIEPTVIKSNKEGHVIPLVKKYNPLCDLILTMGGDGTVGEAFQGFHGQEQHALYTHISTGTTNDVIANFDLVANDMLASLDRILAGRVREIDIMSVNGDPFAYISAFGYVTSVPYLTPNSMKRHFGYAGYVAFGMKEVLKGPRKFQISYTKNGELIESSAIMGIISNTKNFSGIRIYPDADIGDGQFEVLLIKSANLKLIATLLHDFLTNSAKLDSYGERFEVFRTNELILSFDNKKMKIDLCNDGDRYKTPRDENLTLHYTISGKVKMLLPAVETAQCDAENV